MRPEARGLEYVTFERWSPGGVIAGWVVLGFVLSALLLVLSIAYGAGAVSAGGLRWWTVAWAVVGAAGVAGLATATWTVFRRGEGGPAELERPGPAADAEGVAAPGESEAARATEPVVLDTNVFVGAGFHPGSASAGLVAAVRDGRLRMPWTDDTRDEVRRILRRIPPLSWPEVRGLFRDEDRIAGSPAADGLEWIPDPADRKFAALARRAGAVLVSSDRHLLEGRERAEGFRVVTPGEYRA